MLLSSVLGLAAVRIEHADSIRRCLVLYLAGLDFADAYLVARGEALGVEQVLSFDRFDAKLKRSTGVRRLEP